MIEVIAGRDNEMAEWIASGLNVGQFQAPFAAFGFASNGRLFAASLFNDYYRGGSVEWTHYGPRFLPRQAVGFLARFAFGDLQVSRVTAKTRRDNVRVRRMLPKAGFVFEYAQKRYFGPEAADDALVYVMWREQAQRWMQ